MIIVKRREREDLKEIRGRRDESETKGVRFSDDSSQRTSKAENFLKESDSLSESIEVKGCNVFECLQKGSTREFHKLKFTVAGKVIRADGWQRNDFQGRELHKLRDMRTIAGVRSLSCIIYHICQTSHNQTFSCFNFVEFLFSLFLFFCFSSLFFLLSFSLFHFLKLLNLF